MAATVPEVIITGLLDASGDADEGVLVSVTDALIEMGKRRVEDTISLSMEYIQGNRKASSLKGSPRGVRTP